MYAVVAANISHLTFGRETAQFKELLAFMAIISIVSWSFVLVTMVLRLGTGRLWYRRRVHIHSPNDLSP